MMSQSPMLLALLFSLQAAPEPEGQEEEAASPPQVEESQPAEDGESDAPVEGQAAKEEIDDDDKIVCRRTAVIGSKFKKKICATNKQWRDLSTRSREATEAIQRRGRGQEPGSTR